MIESLPVLIVTGPVGVGKTTVAGEISEILEAERVLHAFVDLDALRWFYPHPPGDRFGSTVAIKNLAAVWKNYEEVGVRALVVADIIETPGDLEPYRRALPNPAITVVRLWASIEAMRSRIAQREVGSGLDWHLDRTVELATIMDASSVEDVLIETEGKTVLEVPREVLDRTEWAKALRLESRAE